MELGKIIGIGRFRECYEIVGTDLCAKKLKPLTLNVSLLVSFLLDVNNKEFKVWQKLPEELKPYFLSTYEIKENLLITDRPKDFDGSFSQSLEEYGPISNKYFWESIEFIADYMIKHEIWLFDIFHIGNNIFVKKISEDIYVPVIIDCKRFGWQSYPLQLNLILNSEKRKKFYRRLNRFRKKFKVKDKD